MARLLASQMTTAGIGVGAQNKGIKPQQQVQCASCVSLSAALEHEMFGSLRFMFHNHQLPPPFPTHRVNVLRVLPLAARLLLYEILGNVPGNLSEKGTKRGKERGRSQRRGRGRGGKQSMRRRRVILRKKLRCCMTFGNWLETCCMHWVTFVLLHCTCSRNILVS